MSPMPPPKPSTEGPRDRQVFHEMGQIVRALEAAFERTAILDLRPAQPGDVAETFADVRELYVVTGYRPATPLDVGLAAFAAWWKTGEGRN